MAASSSIEKVVLDRKKAETNDVVQGRVSESNNGGGVISSGHPEKDVSSAQEIESAQARFEATRGKVDALKQVGEYGEHTC